MAMDCNVCLYWKHGLDSWTYPVVVFEVILAVILSAIEINILRRKRVKVNHEKILMSLSISETLASLVIASSLVLIKIAYHMKRLLLAHWLLVVWLCLVIFGVIATLLHLILLTLDRAWAIVAPFHHRVHATSKVVTVSLMLSWIVPIIQYPIYFGIVASGEDLTVHGILQILVGPASKFGSVAILMAYVVFIGSYSLIGLTLFRTISKSQDGKNLQNSSVLKMNRSRKKTLYLCAGTVVSFVVLSFPVLMVGFHHFRVSNRLAELSIVFTPLNGCFNSTLFLVNHYRGRKASQKDQVNIEAGDEQAMIRMNSNSQCEAAS